MSGIAAIIHFNGAPADINGIEKMTAAMAYRGPDGIAALESGPAALGHCMLRSTVEALEEQQPLTNQDHSLTLVMDGFLTNWEELRAELKARRAHLRTGTDAELVLRAYEQWGTACLKHIDGEFAFLIWDERRQEAFCGRDHQGLRPLFYHRDRQRLIVASDISAIISVLPASPPMNEGFLAEMMAEQWYSRTETVWQGIQRVPPAHSLRAAQSAHELQCYWTLPLEVSIKFARESDYIAHYRDLLYDCIRRSSRSHQNIAFEVSGGLDSSSLFCLADKVHKDGRLLAPDFRGYTLIGPPGSEADELRFARAAGHQIGRELSEVPIFTPGLEWFHHQAQLDCDVPSYPSGAMHIGLERKALHDGCRVLINGLGGDQWLDGTRAYYEEQLTERDWRGLAESLRIDATQLGWMPTGRLLARAIVLAALPAFAVDCLRKQFGSISTSPFWLSGQARQELMQRRLDYETRLKTSGRWHYKEFKLNFAYNLLAFDLMNRQRERNGLESRSPMLMRSFIEFSAGTPEYLRLRGHRTKDLHRKAMLGILPDQICERQTKAEFSVAWQALEKDLIAWLRTRTTANPLASLDSAGVERLLAFESHSEIDAMPYWELWAIFAGYALIVQPN